MYNVGTLKEVKCTYGLEVAFRARALLEPPTYCIIITLFLTRSWDLEDFSFKQGHAIRQG